MSENYLNSTIEELESSVWPEPTFRSGLVVTCHQLRKTKLKDFDTGAFRIMIAQNIGVKFLLPLALNLLGSNPLVLGDYYGGDLLCSVVGINPDYWVDNDSDRLRLQEILNRVIVMNNEALEDLPKDAISKFKALLQRFEN